MFGEIAEHKIKIVCCGYEIETKGKFQMTE